MHPIPVSADEIVSAMTQLPRGRNISILDSCGVGRPGSNLLIAALDPTEVITFSGSDPDETLITVEERLGRHPLVAIFTISYDFGLKLNQFEHRRSNQEPDIYLALFDSLIIHDYETKLSYVAGTPQRVDALEKLLDRRLAISTGSPGSSPAPTVRSNFTRAEYIDAVEQIKELIRSGETYQTNLTQQFQVSPCESPNDVFMNLRRDHPASFAALIDRGGDTVVSASPEEFIRIETSENGRRITASPIKGTRPRGLSEIDDNRLRIELLTSEKDRAENTMIVDLMRNDLGRVCEFGSVKVEDLCSIEEHPTLFHLVSSVTGALRSDAAFSDIVKAVFPCGSITGAPKLRTMEIIERIEPAARGLSMGAIGCRIPGGLVRGREIFDMSVAIRTMVVRNSTAVFNVGGGVVIDSDPIKEYDESLLKAKALLRALGAEPAQTATWA